jgi:hypothetical protein
MSLYLGLIDALNYVGQASRTSSLGSANVQTSILALFLWLRMIPEIMNSKVLRIGLTISWEDINYGM